MTWLLSPAARRDLESIFFDGIARFGPIAAEAYLMDLEQVFALLAEQPRMARLRTEFIPPVRIHPHGAHVLIFEESDAGIVILRVRHGRENWLADFS